MTITYYWSILRSQPVCTAQLMTKCCQILISIKQEFWKSLPMDQETFWTTYHFTESSMGSAFTSYSSEKMLFRYIFIRSYHEEKTEGSDISNGLISSAYIHTAIIGQCLATCVTFMPSPRVPKGVKYRVSKFILFICQISN